MHLMLQINFFKLSFFFILIALTLNQAVFAQQSENSFQTITELQTPSRLRARVNFWVDVFGRYSKAQVIIHHRRFPQIRFALLDLEQETAGMNPVAFDSFKDRELKAKLKQVREDIAHLAEGLPARTAQQRNIEQQMRLLGNGLSKYQKIVADPELVRGQSGIREKMAEAIARSGRYLPIMEDIFVNEFGLPVELTRLPFVESSFDYRAYSVVAAAGIWQFMPNTAKSYMRVSSTVDERLDPIESTRAAAKYLKSAYGRLGTWPLALTSYNHGVAGVLNKVRKFGTADISALVESADDPPPFGFASANFFPSYLAAKEVYNRRSEFFPSLRLEPVLQLTMMKLSRAVMVTEIIRKLGTTEEELRQSNYGLSQRIWNGQAAIPAGYNLKVPSRYGARLTNAGFGESTENFSVDSSARIEPIVVAKNNPSKNVVNFEKQSRSEDIRAERLTQKAKSESSYRVKPGDTLYSVARDFGVSVPDLKAANKIKGSSVFVGKILVIPENATIKDINSSYSEPQKTALVKLYTVKKGDSPGAIAKRNGISLKSLCLKNGLSQKNPQVKVGQVLTIPLR